MSAVRGRPNDAPPTRGVSISRDGTRIAWFRSGTGPPLVLVHGATADHTTFRVVEPLLRERFTCYAMDRRGRGASGDRLPYSIVREFEDVAAVVDTAATESGRSVRSVDVLGHSYGGWCALGAALRTPNVRRLVVYEGGPSPDAGSARAAELGARLRALLVRDDRDDREAFLRVFMREVVGMTADELAAFEASPVWAARVAAAHTTLRELEEAPTGESGLDAIAGLRVPVLLLLGGETAPLFRVEIEALAARLSDARIVVLPGQKHAAHHTAPELFVAEVARFLGRSGADADLAPAYDPGDRRPGGGRRREER